MPKVLLVEDDEMLQDMMQQVLDSYDYVVVCASNGAEAVEMAAREQPDVILMDVGLPVLDGHEATRRIKADQATRRIPVIALTAHADKDDRQAALSAGADEYEPKPINFERLFQKVESLLQRGRG